MDRITKAIFIFLAVAVTAILLLFVLVERVPVRTYGVKQFVWGGGIEDKDYDTGYHIGITGFHKWHLLDASTHFLEFVVTPESPGSPGRRSSVGFDARGASFYPSRGGPEDLSTPAHNRHTALEIRNRDGNVVTIDVSVPYRIIPGQAHQIVADGQKASYQDRVKATVESVLREVLSEMSNEAFQDTERRLATSLKALERLNKQLESFHVKADAVLIRRVAFPAEYEEKLQQKQLFTQQASLDQAETLKLVEVLKTGTIDKEIAAAEALSVAEWEKKMESLRADYVVQLATIRTEAVQYSMRTKAEADAVYQTKLAEGKLALDKAEALLVELRSETLATAGGQVYVARLAAENLQIGRVMLNASDPRVPLVLDVHQLADLLMGSTRPPGPLTGDASR